MLLRVDHGTGGREKGDLNGLCVSVCNFFIFVLFISMIALTLTPIDSDCVFYRSEVVLCIVDGG